MTRFYDLFSDCRASLEPFEAALTAAEILKIEHDGAHRPNRSAARRRWSFYRALIARS